MSNTVILYCLVYGESIDRTFPVEIGTEMSVDQLKDLIKEKKSPEFNDIAADKLTLWKVNIPYNAEALRALTLKDDAERGIQNRPPVWKISKAFPDEPAEESIHVIVERPAGDVLNVPARCIHDLSGVGRKRAIATRL